MLYNKCMKIGIYGGTFDPIHVGHITIAKQVRAELGLDVVYFIVASDPPHKQNADRTPAEIRLRMAETALSGCEGLVASDIEIRRGGKSYTVETLEEVRRQRPDDELYLIVGADMLADFPTWYLPKRILELAVLTAVQRTGQAEDLQALAARIEAELGGKVLLPSVCGPEISSTEVRERVLKAKPIGDLVNYKTELYIYENLLYAPETLKQLSKKLAAALEPQRLRHALLTAREAILLADRYGLDTEKARLCGIIHDCAKLRRDRLSDCMERLGFVPTKDETENPYLIHARLGAAVARHEYGIEDAEILTAIERHTLGSPDMTPFDEVIFLADKLEPTREYRKVASMRKLAYMNLDAAVAAVLRNNIAYTESQHKSVHPSTFSTLAAIEKRIPEQITEG